MLKIKDIDNLVISGACAFGGGYMMDALAKSNLKPVAKVIAIIPWGFWTVKQVTEVLDSIDGTLNIETPVVETPETVEES